MVTNVWLIRSRGVEPKFTTKCVWCYDQYFTMSLESPRRLVMDYIYSIELYINDIIIKMKHPNQKLSSIALELSSVVVARHAFLLYLKILFIVMLSFAIIPI